VNALDLGTVNVTSLNVTAAGGVTDSGVLMVSGNSQFTAAGQIITLNSANDFGGAVSVTASSARLNDVNGLDLGTVNVTSLSVTAAGAVTDSGVLTVRGNSQVTAAGQSITLDSANDFGGQLVAQAQRVVVHAVNDLNVSLAASQMDLRSAQGDVNVTLTSAGPVEAHVVAEGQVSLMHAGSLALASGSIFESKTDAIAIIATGDLLASGTTLLAQSALLKSDQAIKATALEHAAPVSFTGELRLEAVNGIGGFGFERVLVRALTADASVSARNSTRGDVVIAGQNGLTVSVAGITSESDGWVGLMGGAGNITELGQVVASSQNVVRMTGVTWMPPVNPNGARAITMVAEALKSGWSPVAQLSPLEQMNQSLAKSWTSNTTAQSGEKALSAKAEVLVTKARAQLGEAMSHATSSNSASVMASPQSTAQFLELAMAASQQGQQPAVNDKETLTSWIVRTSPSESNSSSESTRKATPLPRETAIQTDVPNSFPAVQTPVSPTDTAPAAPVENPSGQPTSGVRWLLPEGDLSQLVGFGMGFSVPEAVTDDAGVSEHGAQVVVEGNDQG
jgi:hypothetical protein